MLNNNENIRDQSSISRKILKKYQKINYSSNNLIFKIMIRIDENKIYFPKTWI